MSQVQVVILKDVPNLGKVGDTVQVKLGYARNFLLPQGLATEVGSLKAKEVLALKKAKKLEKTATRKVKEVKKEEQAQKRKIANLKKSKLLAKK